MIKKSSKIETKEQEHKNVLTSFMAKKKNDKNILESSKKGYSAKLQNDKKSHKDGEMADDVAEGDAKVAEAKKESQYKAKQYSQVEMFKKLVMENIAKSIFVVIALAALVFIAINLAPAIARSFDGIVYKSLMTAIGQKY